MPRRHRRRVQAFSLTGTDVISVTLDDGRLLQLNLNRRENRLIGDVVEKDGRWGNEFVRCVLPPAITEEEKLRYRALLRSRHGAARSR